MKFEVGVWIWSFEVGEEENDKATEQSSYRSVKKGLTWTVTTCDFNEKDEDKFFEKTDVGKIGTAQLNQNSKADWYSTNGKQCMNIRLYI